MKDELLKIAETLQMATMDILSNVDSDVAPDVIQPLINSMQRLNYLAGTVAGGEGNGSE